MTGIENTFVIGGCRSGKSTHALELAERIPGGRKLFIATCVPRDDEMEQRVIRHQRERGEKWSTLEEPVAVPEAIHKEGASHDVILVDCLTLWMSNLLLESDDQERIAEHARALVRAIEASPCPVILVSNEVGAGIVPENRLARLFRDVTGHANQAVAGCVDRVIWMVAGIPVTIKPV